MSAFADGQLHRCNDVEWPQCGTLPSDYNQTFVNDSYQDGWLLTLLAVGNVTWNRTELLRVAVAPSEVIVLLGNSLNFFSPSTLVVH